LNAFTLFGRIALDDKQYQAGLKKAETETTKSAGKIERDWKKVGDQISKTGKALSVGLTGAIAAVASAAVASAVAVGNYADKILDLAQQTGLSTDRLQAFERVAIEAGTSTDVLARSAQMLTMRLSATGEESKGFTDTMQVLGVETRNANGSLRSMDDLLPDVMRNLAGVEDITTRNALATELFGRSSADILPVLALGADRIDELTQEAMDLGQVLSIDALNAANDFRRAQESLTDSIRRAWREVSVALLPIMTQLVEFINANVLPAIRSFTGNIVSLIERFQQLTGTQQGLIVGVGLFAAALGPALLIIAKMLTVVPAVTAAFASLRLAMLALVAGPAAPFVLIGLAIGALFLAWQNNVGGMQETFAAFVVDVRESFQRTWQSLRSAFEAISSAWSSLASQNSENWSRFTAFANRVFGNLVTGLLGGIAFLLRGLARIIEITSNIIVNFEELGTAARFIFEEIQRIVQLSAINMQLSFQAFVLQVRVFFANMANNIRDVFFNIVDGIRNGFNQLVGFVEPVAESFGISVNRMQEVNRDAFATIGADAKAELEGITDNINSNNRQISQAQGQIAETVRRSLGIIFASSTAASNSTGEVADSINDVDAAANQTGSTLRNTFTPAVEGASNASSDATEEFDLLTLAGIRAAIAATRLAQSLAQTAEERLNFQLEILELEALQKAMLDALELVDIPVPEFKIIIKGVNDVATELRALANEYLEVARVARLASTDQNMFNMAGLEGSSNIDAFNDHLKVLARDQENAAAAGLLGSQTLEEFAAAAERAALRAEEMNAGLDAGAPLLRLTAVEAAAAATSLADFMRVQVALGAAGEADLLRVLQNQAAALQVARSAVNAGTDEWMHYSRELIEVNRQIDALNAKLTVTAPTTLDVANANLRAARAAKLLGDETADVAGALSLQVLEMESLLGTLDPTSEAYLRLAESIAAAKREMDGLTNTKRSSLDFANTISTAVAGLAVTMIGLAAAGGDVARNVALAFAEMAQNVLNQILTMAIAELVLHNIRTALAASSPFTAWMIFGLAAGALAAGALVAQLRSMGARAPGGASGGAASGGIIGSLQDRRSFLSRALTEATSERDIELINKQIQQIDEELRRLRGIGIDEETGELVDNLPVDSSAGRRGRDVGFGGVPQSVQLAVSTPLLEASNRMLDAATMMQQVFGSMLPGSMTPDASMGNFAGVLSRMTPVLERLLTEGVEIRTAGLAQPQSAGLAFLR